MKAAKAQSKRVQYSTAIVNRVTFPDYIGEVGARGHVASSVAPNVSLYHNIMIACLLSFARS
jgi:hypothetical protein